jgi:ribose transport system permease protein
MSSNSQLNERRFYNIIAKYGTLIALGIMIILFSILKPTAFPTVLNFINVLNQGSLAAIIGCGLTAVVIVGEFDMSIAYIASLSGVLVAGFMVNQHMPILVAVLAVLVVALILGFLNGLIITKLKVSSVIATIGSGGIIVGLNYAYSNGTPIATGVPRAFLDFTLIRVFGVIPINIIVMLVMLALLWVIVNKTELGYRIRAVGGNAQAAELSGVSVTRTKIMAFMISAVSAAITGILLCSVIGSGATNAGDSYLMNAFAAVFLGSATLKNGEFHIIGTFIGVFIINIGFNGLAIFGVPTYSQYIFQGAVLIGAVALSTIARLRAEK